MHTMQGVATARFSNLSVHAQRLLRVYRDFHSLSISRDLFLEPLCTQSAMPTGPLNSRVGIGNITWRFCNDDERDDFGAKRTFRPT